jgi:hypothetical protein
VSRTQETEVWPEWPDFGGVPAKTGQQPLEAEIDALMDGYDEHPAQDHPTLDELQTVRRAVRALGLVSDHSAKCRFCARMSHGQTSTDVE